MSVVCDPIMDEVYSIRHDLSASCGHDVGEYFNIVKNEVQRAKALGVSYLDYYLSQLNAQSGCDGGVVKISEP